MKNSPFSSARSTPSAARREFQDNARHQSGVLRMARKVMRANATIGMGCLGMTSGPLSHRAIQSITSRQADYVPRAAILL